MVARPEAPLGSLGTASGLPRAGDSLLGQRGEQRAELLLASPGGRCQLGALGGAVSAPLVPLVALLAISCWCLGIKSKHTGDARWRAAGTSLTAAITFSASGSSAFPVASTLAAPNLRFAASLLAWGAVELMDGFRRRPCVLQLGVNAATCVLPPVGVSMRTHVHVLPQPNIHERHSSELVSPRLPVTKQPKVTTVGQQNERGFRSVFGTRQTTRKIQFRPRDFVRAQKRGTYRGNL